LLPYSTYVFLFPYTSLKEAVLLRVKEQRNSLHEIGKRKANWIGHILRRNCILQRVKGKAVPLQAQRVPGS